MIQLTNSEQWVLGALSDGPKHGYAIAKWVKEQSNGKVDFSGATLHQNLQKLLEKGLVKEDGQREVRPGRRRMVYSIKEGGARVLREHTRDALEGGGLAWVPS